MQTMQQARKQKIVSTSNDVVHVDLNYNESYNV